MFALIIIGERDRGGENGGWIIAEGASQREDGEGKIGERGWGKGG